MSMKSWKKEFYPVKPNKKMSKLKAIQHSLTKWEGLLRKNLKKHGIEVDFWGDIREMGVELFLVDADSCALCCKYMYQGDPVDKPCVTCPLYKTLGKCCGEGDENDPFTKWKDESDPKPMIRALKKCLKENS